MGTGAAACLQYRGSDSREVGKTHSNPDHVYISTLQYSLIPWPTWETLTSRGPPFRGLRAGREWPAKGSGCDFERTFTKLVKWKEAAGTTAEAAGFINSEPNQSGRNSLHQSRVQLRKAEVVPPAMTLSKSLYKWTIRSKWPQRSFGEVPVGKITRVLLQLWPKKKRKIGLVWKCNKLKSSRSIIFSLKIDIYQ